MKKYLKTTLGRKLLAFYLVLFAITFYLITTVGRDYISERVESESISKSPQCRNHAAWLAHQ